MERVVRTRAFRRGLVAVAIALPAVSAVLQLPVTASSAAAVATIPTHMNVLAGLLTGEVRSFTPVAAAGLNSRTIAVGASRSPGDGTIHTRVSGEPRALPAPRITHFSASRTTLQHAGGVVLLHVRTEHATSCRLTMALPHRVPVHFSPRSSVCNGTVRITLGGNRRAQWLRTLFDYVAHRGQAKSSRRLAVGLAPAPAPAPAPQAGTSPTTAPEPAPPASGPTPAPSSGSSGSGANASVPTSPPTGGSGAGTGTGGAPAPTPTPTPTPTPSTGTSGSGTAATGSGTGSATTMNVPSAVDTAALTPDATSTLTPQPTANWAGYVVHDANPLDLARGSFTVPTLDCAATPNAGVSFWVGVGGVIYLSASQQEPLLQTGVTAQCTNGTEQDFGWWEEVPSTPNYAENFTNFAVKPGDTLSAEVAKTTDGQWETILVDESTGLEGVMVTGGGWGVTPTSADSFVPQGTTTDLSYPGGTTAEWITEEFTDASTNQLVPLAAFAPVDFTGLAAGPAFSGIADNSITDPNGKTLAVPGQISPSGFSVTYSG